MGCIDGNREFVDGAHICKAPRGGSEGWMKKCSDGQWKDVAYCQIIDDNYFYEVDDAGEVKARWRQGGLRPEPQDGGER